MFKVFVLKLEMTVLMLLVPVELSAMELQVPLASKLSALPLLAVTVVAMGYIGVGVGAVGAVGNGWVPSALQLFVWSCQCSLLEVSLFNF